MNRELTSRIRAIPNLIAHHKPVVKNDLKLAMKIVECMDERWNLWQEAPTETTTTSEQTTTTTSTSTSGGGDVGTNGGETTTTTTTASESKDETTTTTSGDSPVKTAAAAAAAAETDYAKLEDLAFSKLPLAECPPIKHKVLSLF